MLDNAMQACYHEHAQRTHTNKRRGQDDMARMSRQMKEAMQELERRGATILEAPKSLSEVRIILRNLGPRQVGGHYIGGYYQQVYIVTQITVEGYRWSITVEREGQTVTHSTPWNYHRDLVLV